MKMLVLILSTVLFTGCATDSGARFIPILDPVPGYVAGPDVRAMNPPGTQYLLINGQSLTISPTPVIRVK